MGNENLPCGELFCRDLQPLVEVGNRPPFHDHLSPVGSPPLSEVREATSSKPALIG